MPLCPECDFDFDTSAQEKLQIIVRVPQRACQLTEVMGDAVYTRRGPTVWSPNEYIWHMADMFHAGTEMLHAAQVQDHPTIVVPNGDLLAQARDYSVLSLETGLWSLERSARSFMKEVAEADLERTVFVQFSKDNVVERPARAILGLMSHDASHHLFDIERMRKA